MPRQAAIKWDSMDLRQLVEIQTEAAMRIQQRREALAAQMEEIDAAIRDLGSPPASKGAGSGRRMIRVPKRVAARRGKRGAGWESVRAALESIGGKGTNKQVAEKLGSSKVGNTPLSVAMASYLKSGRVSKRGEGREAVYSLSAGGGEPTNGRAAKGKRRGSKRGAKSGETAGTAG